MSDLNGMPTNMDEARKAIIAIELIPVPDDEKYDMKPKIEAFVDSLTDDEVLIRLEE